MAEKLNINKVLADNLAAAMAKRGMTQAGLAKSSGVGQTTISLYLRPEARSAGASGKAPSAKLSEVAMLAEALGIEPWALIKPQEQGEIDLAIEIQDAVMHIVQTRSANKEPKPPSRKRASA